MKEINFQINVGSDTDFEDLIADIGYDDKLVALLTQENGVSNMRIRIFSPPAEEYWDFRLDELEAIIQKAKNRLGTTKKI